MDAKVKMTELPSPKYVKDVKDEKIHHRIRANIYGKVKEYSCLGNSSNNSFFPLPSEGGSNLKEKNASKGENCFL